MEQSEKPIIAEEQVTPETTVRPVLALQREDVGDLDTVLRGYYLGQIKNMEKRKDRKLSRQLLENHLVLPKSRQRTSKDSAYIKEILGIEYGLLERLEDSRLIRRIHKSGNNPIYEISHDTLVEPILAERRDREAITRFIKRTWKYLVALLLLWFLFGMLFENSFELIPDPVQGTQSVAIELDEVVLDIGDDPKNASLALPSHIITRNQTLKPGDTLNVQLPLNLVSLSSIVSEDATGSDTISIKLENPIEVPIAVEGLPVTYQTFSDVVVPLAHSNGDAEDPDANKVYAKLSGNLKMTPLPKGMDQIGDRISQSSTSDPIEVMLGDTLLQAAKDAQSLPLNFHLQLTDLFENEDDKNSIRNALGDREVKLSYTVQVGPAPTQAPPPKAELPSVQGIEVQYSDGTSKFIPGDAASGAGRQEKIHIVVAGETLYSVAKEYGIVDVNGNISAEIIKKLNGLQGDALSVGQALRIPVVR